MSAQADDQIVVVGRERTIEYAIAADGSCPAREFLESLPESDLHKIAALFQRMAATGKIYNVQKFRHEEGKIYSFKVGRRRIGCFQIGARWLLTHGFNKQKDKWPRSELDRAKRIMNEHLDREG